MPAVKQPRKKGRVIKRHTIAAESVSIESKTFWIVYLLCDIISLPVVSIFLLE